MSDVVGWGEGGGCTPKGCFKFTVSIVRHSQHGVFFIKIYIVKILLHVSGNVFLFRETLFKPFEKK